MPYNWKSLKLVIGAGLIPPVFFQLFSLATSGTPTMHTLGEYAFWFSLSLSVTVVLSIIVFQEIRWLEKLLPWKKHVAWRIIVEFIVTNATVLGAMAILALYTYEAHCQFFGEPLTYKKHLFTELTLGIVLLTILLSILEGTYFFQEWKKSLLLNEKLEKQNVESQLEALKNQVSPHFLFNSLNVLSNLVHKDADRAEEFIDQFASVYRYVLSLQDKMAVTLGEELKFIKSYIFLQKIRFQEGFNVEFEIASECEDHFIVPLSLQLLVENAIKHNVVDKEAPLNIKIFLEDDKVYVVNKINLRSDENNSVGMGLKNLRQRYFLLANIMPELKEEDGNFIVGVPLLKPEKENSKNEEDKCCHYRRRILRSGKA